jgi:hypothetical protein
LLMHLTSSIRADHHGRKRHTTSPGTNVKRVCLYETGIELASNICETLPRTVSFAAFAARMRNYSEVVAYSTTFRHGNTLCNAVSGPVCVP